MLLGMCELAALWLRTHVGARVSALRHGNPDPVFRCKRVLLKLYTAWATVMASHPSLPSQVRQPTCTRHVNGHALMRWCCRQTLFVTSSFGRGVRCLRAPSTSPFEETAEPTHARTWMWRVLPDACMGWHDMAVRPTVLRMLAATQRACWWRH